MLRAFRTVLIFSVVALALTACGDEDGDGGGDGLARQDPVPADTLLAQVRPTEAGPQQIDTRLQARLEGEARGAAAAFVDTPLELQVTGRGDNGQGAADLRVTLDAGVLKADGRFVAVGGRNFAQLLDEWYVLPESDGVFSAVTPALLAEPDVLLADDAQVIGTEDVDGVPCDVVEGQTDADAVAERLAGVVGVVPLLGDAAGLDAAALRDALEGGTARVWIGRDDKEVHRVRVDTTVELTATTLGAQGLRRGELTLDGRAVEAEGPVEVEAPADARPVEELQERLGGLVPAASPS